MRLVSFLAPTCKQAMAELRAGLGEDAIILATRTLADGQVRVTGAIAEESLDLGELLTPSGEPRSFEWLASLCDFHEWPFPWRERVEPVLKNAPPADPEVILATLLRAFCRFSDLIGDGRKPLLLSGPPGGGKTITVVKLAAAQILKGKSVDILTLDVEPAGAFDRLKALLSPLGLQPKAVPAIADLADMVDRCSGDMILLDGPSTNPFLPSDLSLLSTASSHSDAALIPVMPAHLGYGDSMEIARSYMALGARSMVVTKLDAVRRLGGVMGAAEAGLALTEAGIGPSIGDGLRKLGAEGLARLLLRRYRSAVDGEACR